MLSFETIIAFFTASIILALAPGPDNIFVLTQSALSGRKSGFAVTAGLCTGLVGHTTAVALGIAAIFHTSAAAFSVLKYIGAAYLLYLAWQAFRSKSGGSDVPDSFESPGVVRLYGRGIIMNITNPKVSIFFLAFLPQFTNPAAGAVWIQIMLLGGLFIIATVFIFGGIAILSGTISQWFNRSPRVRTVLNRIAGTVFISLAIKLAFAERN